MWKEYIKKEQAANLPSSYSARMNIIKQASEVSLWLHHHTGLFTSIRTMKLHSIFERCHRVLFLEILTFG